MGLFEDIGETIGNACNAIAEFFGDVFEVAATSVFSTLHVAGDALMKQMLIEMAGSDTEIKSNAAALSKLLKDDIITDANNAIQTALDYSGTLEPGEATRMLKQLHGPIDEHMIAGVIFAVMAEAVTLGQLDGVQNLMAMEDKLKGFSHLVSTMTHMKIDAGLFQPYLKELNAKYQNIIPGPTDLIRMQLREVFDPEFRPELLLPGTGQEYKDAMKESGFNEYWSDSYWAAHWVLPSLGELDEMLHRRIIEPEAWATMVRRNDYLPAWIENRKKIIYSPYTRVDARRMWDLRMLSKEEVYWNYRDLGYDEEHATKMKDWTLVYVAAGDIRARLSKGWISAAEARTELLEAGMPEDRVDVYLEKLVKETGTERTAKERDLTKTDITRSVKKGLLEKDEGAERLQDMGYSEDEAYFIIDSTVSESTSAEIEADRDISKADIIKGIADGVFTEAQGLEMLMKLGYSKEDAQYIIDIRVPPKKPEKMKPERDLTKAEIVKGVKKEILSWDQGAAMLFDMGYDHDEADFILAINIEALTGSPETWSEMQSIVNKGRKVQGLPVKEIPSSITTLEDKLKEYAAIESKAKADGETRDFFIALEKQRGPMKRQHKQLVEQYQKGVK